MSRFGISVAGWLIYCFLIGIFSYQSSIATHWYSYEGFWMYAIQNPGDLVGTNSSKWSMFGPAVTWLCWAASIFPTNLAGVRIIQWCLGATTLALTQQILAKCVADSNGGERTRQSELGIIIGVVAISLNPYLFPALVKFSPLGLVLFLVVLNLFATIQTLRHESGNVWVLILCVGLPFHALTHHWGLIFNFCIVGSLLLLAPVGKRWKKSVLTLTIGTAVPLIVGGLWFQKVNNHYFGTLVSMDLQSFSTSITTLLIPTGELGASLASAIGLLTIIRILWILILSSNQSQKVLAIVFLLFFGLVIGYQVLSAERVVHHYLKAPFAILGCIVLATLVSERIAPLIALALLATISFIPETWINNDQKRFAEIANEINDKCTNGFVSVFSGSPSFFWLYPFLEKRAKNEALIVVDSSGGYVDAFEGHLLLPESKTRNGNFAVNNVNFSNSNFVVIETEISQGIVFDLDARWSRSIETFFVSRRQPIGKIYISTVRVGNSVER